MQQTKLFHLRSVLKDVATKLEYLLPLALSKFSDLDDKEVCLLLIPSSISPPTMDMVVRHLSYLNASLKSFLCPKHCTSAYPGSLLVSQKCKGGESMR